MAPVAHPFACASHTGAHWARVNWRGNASLVCRNERQRVAGDNVVVWFRKLRFVCVIACITGRESLHLRVILGHNEPERVRVALRRLFVGMRGNAQLLRRVAWSVASHRQPSPRGRLLARLRHESIRVALHPLSVGMRNAQQRHVGAHLARVSQSGTASFVCRNARQRVTSGAMGSVLAALWR